MGAFLGLFTGGASWIIYLVLAAGIAGGSSYATHHWDEVAYLKLQQSIVLANEKAVVAAEAKQKRLDDATNTAEVAYLKANPVIVNQTKTVIRNVNHYISAKDNASFQLPIGLCILLDIDVAGAEQVRDFVETLPPADPMRRGFIDIFINPPDLEELRQRLVNRATDSKEVIEKRIRNAEREMARAGEYMYQIVNDDLDVAYRRLCDIINVRAGLI